MTNKTIPQLADGSGLTLDGTEEFEIVKAGVTYRLSLADMFSNSDVASIYPYSVNFNLSANDGTLSMGSDGSVSLQGSGPCNFTFDPNGVVTISANDGKRIILDGDAWSARPLAVADLPAAATAGNGARAFVTDALTTLALGIGTVVANGGANKVPVYSDGTDWLYG